MARHATLSTQVAPGHLASLRANLRPRRRDTS